MNTPFLAWLYWDPPREAFNIPYFDISVAWYGIFFAGGFVIGYFILLPIIQQVIEQSQKVYPRDVSNWPLLAEQFKDENSPYLYALSHKGRQELNSLSTGKEPSAALKQELLLGLNRILKDSNLHRKVLENHFSGSFVKSRSLASSFVDRLTWFIVIGTIIGARLGHVFFYDWPYYSSHLAEIFMIRKGGLASHGGTIGVMLGLIFFLWLNRKQFPSLSFISLMDFLVIPTAFVATCIRLGNFFNQEIVGYPTQLPWAIIFGHPVEGGSPVPSHPTQLYEAAIYILIFILLSSLWKLRGVSLTRGTLSGLFFVLVFGSRFLIEFLKLPQGAMLDGLQMGQWLSIPFVCLGLALLIIPRLYSKTSFCLENSV